MTRIHTPEEEAEFARNRRSYAIWNIGTVIAVVGLVGSFAWVKGAEDKSEVMSRAMSPFYEAFLLYATSTDKNETASKRCIEIAESAQAFLSDNDSFRGGMKARDSVGDSTYMWIDDVISFSPFEGVDQNEYSKLNALIRQYVAEDRQEGWPLGIDGFEYDRILKYVERFEKASPEDERFSMGGPNPIKSLKQKGFEFMGHTDNDGNWLIRYRPDRTDGLSDVVDTFREANILCGEEFMPISANDVYRMNGKPITNDKAVKKIGKLGGYVQLAVQRNIIN